MPLVAVGCSISVLDQFFLNIETLKKQLPTRFNENTSACKFGEILDMYNAIKQGELEPYMQQLPPHFLDFAGCFNIYRVFRQFFDLHMNFLSAGTKLLHPEKKPKPQKTKKIKITTAPTAESLTEAFVEPKECVATLTEVATAVAVHLITEPTETPKKASKCILAFPIQEQKNDTAMLPIKLSKIHPALQFIAGLGLTESEMLLSWIAKAPHMQVQLSELERTIKNLNGKIDSSGGGSHHRIIFQNSLAFVDDFEQGSTTGTTSTAKGTLVKPHGKGKSPRFLPSYAIKTFMQTLQKMGVTETILRIYTHAHKSCTDFKNPQNKMVLLTNAQSALIRDQSKMGLLSCFYKNRQNQKGNDSAVRKLNTVCLSKDAKQGLMRRIFLFL